MSDTPMDPKRKTVLQLCCVILAMGTLAWASVPLYDGLRPLVEPADAYLAWMRERVAAARAANPDFKGEWVYFFVTTAPE